MPLIDALLAAWLPGSEAGGIADVIFGNSEPSGRLPVTWPRGNFQIPIHINEDQGAVWSEDQAGKTLHTALL